MAKKKKAWSYIAGEKGRNSVRAYLDAKSGKILLEFYEQKVGEGRVKRRLSTHHADPEQAEQQAEELALEIRKSPPIAEPPPVAERQPAAELPPSAQLTLGKLFDMYLEEVSPRKGLGSHKHDERCAVLFTRCFGIDRKPLTLAKRDFDRFIDQRGDGRLAVGNRKTGVGDRMIGYDLRMLMALFNWATVAGDGNGGHLLAWNPFKGFPIPEEASPRRPATNEQQYNKLKSAASRRSGIACLFLLVTHETGHRCSAVAQIRWNDLDLSDQTDQSWVRWRGEVDKEGFEHRTPLSEAAVAALRESQRVSGRSDEEWVFPSPTDSRRPVSRNHLRDLWIELEASAGLPHEKGKGWHSLRRKFATDLKGTPLPDLCYLGGWQSSQTLVKCYMKADETTMRGALEQRVKVRATGRS